MGRAWDSVFLIGLFFLTFVLVVLCYRPAPGPRGAFVDIDTQLQGESGKVKVAKLKMSLNEQKYLDNFPRQIGDRQGIDGVNTPSIETYLKADALIIRTYTKDGLSQPIFLVLLHSPRSGSFHPPPVCYEWHKYSIAEESEDTIYVKDTALRKRISEQSWDTIGEWLSVKLSIPIYTAEIPVNKLIVHKINKGEIVERRLVFYFYMKDLEFVSHEFTMLRVSALLPRYGNYDGVETEMKDFMSEVLALIFEDYGEEKEMVISIIASFGPKGYSVIAVLFAIPLAMIIYPLATRKIFNWGRYERVTEQEGENAGKTLEQPAEGMDKVDETKTITQPPSLPFNLEEKTGNDKILGAYYNSQWIIEKATNTSAVSCPTLRDFLNKVIPILPIETGNHFAELTKMANPPISSVHLKDKRSVTRSCYLADKIIKELYTTAMEHQ